MRLAVCLLVAFSSLITSVLAAPRPGAPRPLHSESTFISGTHAQFVNETLVFARGENSALGWLSAAPRYDRETASKIVNWIVFTGDFEPPELQSALSPDQSSLAYVSKRSGLESIYLESLGERMDDGAIRRIATLARNPAWLNENTLIYESTRPGRKGLFRITIPADGSTPGEPQLLFSRGGEAAVSRDGKLICLAITDDKSSSSQLYLLSANGSGARVLAQTEGARRPVFSPDGKAIFFDAPAPIEGAAPTPARERVLWMIPIENNVQANTHVTLPSSFVTPSKNSGSMAKPEVGPAQNEMSQAAMPQTVVPKNPAPVTATVGEDFDFDEILPFPLSGRSTPPSLARRGELETASEAVKSLQKANTGKSSNTPPKNKPAPKNNAGIPSQMKKGSTVPVTIMLRNTGSRSWSSTGESPVRLIYRWVGVETDILHRWAVHWLREVVQPGESTQMKFDLIAPPATGRYVLTYALVRLNDQNYDGKNYKPPSGKSKDHRWPGEFGAVSFNITVTP